MAYKRSRRPMRRNKRGYGQRSSWVGIAKTALRTANFLKSLINVETKFIDTTATTNVSATSSIVPLTLCAQGVTDTTRNGNSIKAYKNSLKYNLSISGGTPTDGVVRVMLVLDKVSNGTAPLISDILDNTGALTETLCHYNGDNMGSRFIILDDKRYHLDTSGREQVTGHSFHKLRHHVKYDDTTAVIASATTGHLYLVFVSNNATMAAEPSITYSNRFYFLDN